MGVVACTDRSAADASAAGVQHTNEEVIDAIGRFLCTNDEQISAFESGLMYFRRANCMPDYPCPTLVSVALHPQSSALQMRRAIPSLILRRALAFLEGKRKKREEKEWDVDAKRARAMQEARKKNQSRLDSGVRAATSANPRCGMVII